MTKRKYFVDDSDCTWRVGTLICSLALRHSTRFVWENGFFFIFVLRSCQKKHADDAGTDVNCRRNSGSSRFARVRCAGGNSNLRATDGHSNRKDRVRLRLHGRYADDPVINRFLISLFSRTISKWFMRKSQRRKAQRRYRTYCIFPPVRSPAKR